MRSELVVYRLKYYFIQGLGGVGGGGDVSTFYENVSLKIR